MTPLHPKPISISTTTELHSLKPGLCLISRQRSDIFIDFKHSTVLEQRFYALGKLKNHGVIRIDYCVRDGTIRIINAFKAGAFDCDRYHFGEEDF